MSESPYLDQFRQMHGTRGEFEVQYGDSLAQYSGPTICDTPSEGGATISTTKMVACGGETAIALKNDGTVWAWGQSPGGWDSSRYETPVKLSIEGVVHISAGYTHTLYVKSDGTLWAMGTFSSDFGLPGVEPTTHSGQAAGWWHLDQPTQVPGVYNAIATASGYRNALILLSDGTIRIWGRNDHGQLGNGTTTSSTSAFVQPDITGIDKAVIGKDIATAQNVIVKKVNGEVWGWGTNTGYRLAQDDFDELESQGIYYKATPVRIPVGYAKDIDFGGYWGLALLDNGTVAAWGDAFRGVLGDGHQGLSDKEVESVGDANVRTLAIKDVVQMCAMTVSTILLRSNGDLVSAGMEGWIGRENDPEGPEWNDPTGSPLNNGTFQKIRAEDVGSLFSGVGDAGGYIDGNCEVWSWGDHIPTMINNNPHPTKIVGGHNILTFSATLVSAGGKSNTAQTSDGGMWGWGDNNFGEIGDGTQDIRIAAVKSTKVSG